MSHSTTLTSIPAEMAAAELPVAEELFAALVVAHGCLDARASTEVWELLERAIEAGKTNGLGQEHDKLPKSVQLMLAAVTQ